MISFTKHGMDRMNQRGITKNMIEITVEYGKYINDRIILQSKDIEKLLSKVSQATKGILLKILDKGGLVVVLSDACNVITVFNQYKK